MVCHMYGAVVTDGLYPRLADASPALATEIAELLRAEAEPLAEVVAAPPGSSGSSMIQLERDGVIIIWLSSDSSQATITDIEVLSERDRGPRTASSELADGKSVGGRRLRSTRWPLSPRPCRMVRTAWDRVSVRLADAVSDYAMSSTASPGSRAAVAGVIRVNSRTSRCRCDWST